MLSTLNYYAQNAESFAESTLHIDMSDLYSAFLPNLPALKPEESQHHILDAGCGVARDALAFKNLGHKVTAIDACSELAEIASFHLQQPVYVKTFKQINEQNTYHGIWCCASLLHVTFTELPDRLARLSNALKINGALYISFKYGDTERDLNGRHFTDLTEHSLVELIRGEPTLQLKKIWKNHDLRPERKNEEWLNAVVIKTKP